MDDFFDEGVFLRNDIRFITAVQDVVDVVDGIFGRNLRILFKELQGMPAMIVQVRIFIVQKVAHGVDAVFHFIAVDHGKFTVMVVLMIGLIRMVVDEPVRMDVVLMMDGGMEQDFTVFGAIVDNFPQCNMLISLYFELGELNGDNLVSLMMIKSELGGDNPQAKVSWVMIKSELGGDKKMLVDIIDAMFSTPISSL